MTATPAKLIADLLTEPYAPYLPAELIERAKALRDVEEAPRQTAADLRAIASWRQYVADKPHLWDTLRQPARYSQHFHPAGDEGFGDER